MSWIRRLGLAAALTGVFALFSLEGHIQLQAQEQTHYIYDDELHWDNWSRQTRVRNVESPVMAGAHSLEVQYQRHWAGLLLHHGGFDTSPYDEVQFFLHPSQPGGPFPGISAALYDDSYNLIWQVWAAQYASRNGTGWFHVRIPLADLGGSNRTITAFQLQDATGRVQPVFYIDHLGFVSDDNDDGVPPPHEEVTFEVTTTAPGDNASPGDGRCEDEQGRCTLQAAVQEANALGDVDVTIIVPAGTYRPDSIMLAEEDLCPPFGRCYRLAIEAGGKVHIIGAGETETIIDGDGRPVVWILEGAEVQIEGVTIRGGLSSAGLGAGISNEGNLTLRASTLAENDDIEGGGGILNRGTAFLRKVRVVNNQSGITGQGTGGGIGNHGTMTIESSLIRGNNANIAGGGIFNRGSLTIRDASIVDNSAGPGGGAGIHTLEGRLEVLRLLISGNTTGGSGGGVAAGVETRIIDSTILGNQARNGAGIYGSAILEDAVVQDNRADVDEGNGGGIWVGDEVILRNSSIVNN